MNEMQMSKRFLLILIIFLTSCTQAASTSTEESLANSMAANELTPATEEFIVESPDIEPIQIELIDPEPIDIELPTPLSFDGIGSLYLDQGTYYALLGGFDTDTQYHYVFQAVSHDGLDWVINDSNLTANDLLEGGSCVPRELLRTGEHQWLYFAQCNDGTEVEDPSYIILLTAPEFTGPWTWHPGPVVGGSQSGDEPVWFLDTVETESGYRMYFYYPVSKRIGVADSEDGQSWQILGQDQQETDDGSVFSVLDAGGNEIYARRIEVVWQEGELWHMIYLDLQELGSSLESYSPVYGLAISQDGLRWVSIAGVELPEVESGELMIITSMLATQDDLVATLCKWAPEGGMTCYLGSAQKPLISDP
jgi:hypothetical protein